MWDLHKFTRLIDESTHLFSSLECKDIVNDLGMLLDSNLNWKSHIINIALKMSFNIGVIARLRHFVPVSTLLRSYRSSLVL